MLRKITNILFLLSLLPWVGVAAFSAMLFDAPGSESSPLTQGLFYSIVSYPLLVIVGFFASNGFWRMKDERHWRRHLAFLPVVSVVAAAVFFFAIGAFCEGRFACRPSV